MDCIRPVIEIVTCIGTVIGILTCLWPCCVTHANYLSKLQENRDSLEKALNELKNERDDVQRKVDAAEANPNESMERIDKVHKWLQSVSASEGEVLEILKQVDQQTSRRCLGGCCPDNCWNGYMVGRSVVQKTASLDGLREKGRFKEVACKRPPPSVQEEPTSPTVGMDSMFETVWRLIGGDEVRIMGLYGKGGVGKTTLLKQINNKFLKTTTTSSSSRNTLDFDVVILVVVSKPVNIHAIQREIGKRLGLSSPDKTTIFNTLTKKNFVLLLDDIWERVDLQSIGIPHHPENKKSKVIFTTRSKTVCGYMDANKFFRVDCLAWDKAWTLFQEKVGNETLNSETDPKVLDLAKVVAEKCRGLPLALITIGRAMSTRKTVREWNHAITTLRKSASDFPGMGDGVLPILKLSYDSLRDDTIKSCFLYCALFPEDRSIMISKLIDYWIGEGLILLNEFENIEEARDLGYNIIGILKDACLLENGLFEETQVKMHDTIRDLALWIAHEYRSKRDKMMIIDTYDITTSERLWYNAERICVRILYNPKTKVPIPLSTLNSPNLLTLIYEWTFRTLLIIPQNFFSFMPLLRVLDLSDSRIETFPASITELHELRYLSLSSTTIQALPEELGKLVKLKYLDLSYMRLEKIPSGVIGSLLELRVLNLHHSSAVWDLEEVYKLKHLNDLGITIKTQHNLNKLLSNQSLKMCTRRLHLFSSPSPSSSTTTTTTTLGVDNVKSLEKLELLFNLEILFLDSLSELNMGVWENHHNCTAQEAPFQNLGEIIIEHCNALKDLTWVGYVVNLEYISVSHCEELEEIVIIVDDLGGSRREGGDEISMVMNNVEDVFKRLKRLAILHLPKLKSICRNALAFPCLEEMLVFRCPQVKKLPFDSDSNVNNTLRWIKGGEEWWNELQWEDDNTKLKFLPCFSLLL